MALVFEHTPPGRCLIWFQFCQFYDAGMMILVYVADIHYIYLSFTL